MRFSEGIDIFISGTKTIRNLNSLLYSISKWLIYKYAPFSMSRRDEENAVEVFRIYDFR